MLAAIRCATRNLPCSEQGDISTARTDVKDDTDLTADERTIDFTREQFVFDGRHTQPELMQVPNVVGGHIREHPQAARRATILRRPNGTRLSARSGTCSSPEKDGLYPVE